MATPVSGTQTFFALIPPPRPVGRTLSTPLVWPRAPTLPAFIGDHTLKQDGVLGPMGGGGLAHTEAPTHNEHRT